MTGFRIDPRIADVLREGLRREGWPKPARAAASDRGGLTRGGITAVNWGEWRHLGRPATAAELDAITEPDALEFYYQRYVLLPHFDQVLDPQLRALLIDWAFTSWSDDPVKALQTSLQLRYLYIGAIDGVLGPKTIAALQVDREPRRLFRDVYNARIRFYLDLAFAGPEVTAFLKAHPTSQLHNGRGWVFRCLEFTP
jgi:lysozyme family protein